MYSHHPATWFKVRVILTRNEVLYYHCPTVHTIMVQVDMVNVPLCINPYAMLLTYSSEAKSFCLSSSSVVALVLLTVFGPPPASWLLDLNEFFKHEFWAN